MSQLMARAVLCTEPWRDLMISGIQDETISTSVYYGWFSVVFMLTFFSCTKAVVYNSHIIFALFNVMSMHALQPVLKNLPD